MGRGTVIALVCLALIGLVHLPYPFGGDQALFMAYARGLDQGGTLYVDFWDLKQPGMFLLYWLAGRLGGFSEHSVHLLELLYLLFTSWFISTTAPLRRAWLVPLVAFGTYYAAGGPTELTQLELLAVLPIYFCLWAGWRRDERPWVMWCGGAAVGLVAVFKLVLAPLPALLLLAGMRRVQPLIRAAAAGTAVVAAVCVWLAWRGALDDMLWTTFMFPGLSLKYLPPRNPVELAVSAKWFVIHFAPWVAGAALALPWLARTRERFFVLTLTWVAVALALITIQVLSWWPYHFGLIMLPVALLAVAWLERVPDRWAMALAAAGLLLYSPQMARKLRPLTWAAVRGDAQASSEYRQAISPVYRYAANQTLYLKEPGAAPGSIYVLGNPVYLWLSGRIQAPALDGWAAQYRTPDQWQSFAVELREKLPPYLFTETEYAWLIPRHSPETARVLDACYDVKSRSETGTWYQLKPAKQNGVPVMAAPAADAVRTVPGC